MKQSFLYLVALSVVFSLGSTLAAAQHGRGAGGSMGGPTGGRGGTSTVGNPDRPDMPSARRSTAGKETSTTGQRKTAGELLTQNTKLSSKLQSLLPTGTDLQTASSGFKNLGQFVAAAHVSHNLGISFDSLKAKLMAGDSLGKAIHELNPNVNAKAEAKKANNAADKDVKESGS